MCHLLMIFFRLCLRRFVVNMIIVLLILCVPLLMTLTRSIGMLNRSCHLLCLKWCRRHLLPLLWRLKRLRNLNRRKNRFLVEQLLSLL
ncbi:MAG: hypothetical protein [Microviridae sp.]|nr:MAG: hypothetical protein [Microviridae sp.]